MPSIGVDSPQGGQAATKPPPLPNTTVGALLKRYRVEHNLSQAELAQLLHLDQSYVSRLERGIRRLGDVKELRSIAGKLGIPAEEFGVLPYDSGHDSIARDFDPTHALSLIRLARERRTWGDPIRAYDDLQSVAAPLETWASKQADVESNLLHVEMLLAQSLILGDLLGEEELSRPAQDMAHAWQLIGQDDLDAPSAYILGTLGNYLRRSGKLTVSVPVLERALTYRGEPEEAVATATILAKAESTLGRADRFVSALRTARENLERCAVQTALVSDFSITEIEARGLLQLGHVRRAIRVLDSRDGSGELLAIPQWRIIFAITRAEALAADGRRPDAVTLLNDAARAAAAVGLPHQLQAPSPNQPSSLCILARIRGDD